MRSIIQLILLFSFIPQGMADPIYRYQDEGGKTVYTDTPPDQSQFEEFKPKALFVMSHKPPTIHARYYNMATKGRISPLIQNIAQMHEMDPYLVEAVVKAESDYDPMAVSRVGAQGLMQIMPMTGLDLGLQNPFDPTENLDAGIRHLKKLMAKYQNNLDLALAAYNAGEMSVQKYKGVPPYPETIDYIQKIKKYYWQFSTQSTTSLKQGDVTKPVPYL